MDEDILRVVDEDPALPRILLIGDSISMGYTIPVREALAGKVNVQRIPTNGSSTWVGLEHLDEWLGEKKWDLIHFNWGLHDVKYMKDGKLDLEGTQVSSLEQYTENLDKLIVRLKRTGAKLIWATTTPVPEGASGRKAGDCETYNDAVLYVVGRHEVAINDLFAFAKPILGEIQLPENVHFSDEGSARLGKEVARRILEVLKLQEG